MQNGTENREKLDRFSQYMQDRLADHRMDVDPSGWEVIDAHFRRQKRIRTLTVCGILAAALLGGLIWMVQPPVTEPLLPEEVIVQKSEMPVQPESRKEEVIVPQETVPSIEKKTSSPLLAVIQSKAHLEEQQQIKQIEQNDIPETIEYPEEINAEETITEEEQPVREDVQTGRNVTVNREPTQPARRYGSEVRTTRLKKKSSWMVSAGFGSGGNIGFPSSSEDYAYNDFSPSPGEIVGEPLPPKPQYPMHNGPKGEDYSNIEHSIPLSFGVTFRKSITPVWAVESGLIYSYLSTRLSGGSLRYQTGKLELHYLGIPVNLVANLWGDSRWNVYLSGGVLLEKGLQSVFTAKVYSGQDVSSTKEKDSVNGIQVSLNGALGIGYRFYDNWSLYAEPKIYYYFDTDQPISIRTEHPFGVGLSAGFRYQF